MISLKIFQRFKGYYRGVCDSDTSTYIPHVARYHLIFDVYYSSIAILILYSRLDWLQHIFLEANAVISRAIKPEHLNPSPAKAAYPRDGSPCNSEILLYNIFFF